MSNMDDVVCQVAPEWWGTYGAEHARPGLAVEGCKVCPALGEECLGRLAAGGPLELRDVDRMVASGLMGQALVAAVNEIAEPRRELRPCGTLAAYRRHLRRGERPCAACRAASREQWRDRREVA